MSPHYNNGKEIEAFLEYECYDIPSLSHDHFVRVLHLFVLHHEIIDKNELILGDTFVDTSHVIHHLMSNRSRDISSDSVALCLYRILIDVLSCGRLDVSVILMNIPYLYQALISSSTERQFLHLHIAYANGPITAISCEVQFEMFRTFVYEQYANLGIGTNAINGFEHETNHDAQIAQIEREVQEEEDGANGDIEVQDIPDADIYVDESNDNEGAYFSSLSSFSVPLKRAHLPEILQKNALHMAARSDCIHLFQDMARIEGDTAFSLRDANGNLVLHSVIGRTDVSISHFSTILEQNIQHYSHANGPNNIDHDDRVLRFRGLLTKNNAGMTPIDLILQLVWYNYHHEQDEEVGFEVYEACMECLDLVNEKFNDIFHHVIPSKYYYPPALESVWISNATVKEQSSNRLPLHIGALCGLSWSTALEDIFNGYPKAMIEKDPITGLFPALLAATSEGKEEGSPDLGTIYRCVRENPEIFFSSIDIHSLS